jgi:hypothetical protein
MFHAVLDSSALPSRGLFPRPQAHHCCSRHPPLLHKNLSNSTQTPILQLASDSTTLPAGFSEPVLINTNLVTSILGTLPLSYKAPSTTCLPTTALPTTSLSTIPFSNPNCTISTPQQPTAVLLISSSFSRYNLRVSNYLIVRIMSPQLKMIASNRFAVLAE